MERSFISFSFLFLKISPYDLIVFMSTNLRGTFRRADKWMRKGHESATRWRGELSLLKHLEGTGEKDNFSFNTSC